MCLCVCVCVCVYSVKKNSNLILLNVAIQPKVELPYDPAILLLVIYLGKTTNSKCQMHPNFHRDIIYDCQDTCNTYTKWSAIQP